MTSNFKDVSDFPCYEGQWQPLGTDHKSPMCTSPELGTPAQC